jgi:hypothetical protein
MVVTAGATGRRDLGWLRDHLDGAEALDVSDATLVSEAITWLPERIPVTALG